MSTTKPTPRPERRDEEGRRLCDDCSMDLAKVADKGGVTRCLECACEANIRAELIAKRKTETEVADAL